MRVCDGCGAPADEAHIRQRIERLEMATRFRPIHIQTLLLADAPTSRIEDYFYRPLSEGESRSADAREFFVEMMKAAGIAPDAAANEEAALAEFQRRGFYLAHAVECPVATPGELNERITSASFNSPEAHRVLLPPEARRSHRPRREGTNSRVAEVLYRRSARRPPELLREAKYQLRD